METYAALIAIDWADRQHAVCLYDQRTGKREESVVKQTPESLQQWVLSLRARFAGQPRHPGEVSAGLLAGAG